MIFASPTAQDMITIRETLAFFGNASGLHTNLQKSLIAPIACIDEQVQRISTFLPARISEFPIQYLGLPLTVGRLKKVHLQPLVDKVAACISTWKASLMNKAGRLTMVKVVMTSTCTHTFISLKIPEWVISEIDKRRRSFLWAARQKAHGGQCPVAWTASCRPQELGGLGTTDLTIASYALRLRWMWLKRANPDRPWRNLALQFDNDNVLQKMFQASIQVQLGDGNLALFWIDRWNGDSSPCSIAPDLCNTVKSRVRNRGLVSEALQDKKLISDVVGQLTVPAIHPYVLLWHQLQRVQLRPGSEDVITWKWEPSGVYSARSAYRAFFIGSQTSPAGSLI